MRATVQGNRSRPLVQHPSPILRVGTLPVRRHRTTASAATAAVDASAIISELEAMIKLVNGYRAPLDVVQPHLDKIEKLSAALGTNKVDPTCNSGQFEGVFTTDMRQISVDSESTFGRCCFSKFQPADLKVTLGQYGGTQGFADLFKGDFEGRPHSYVVNFGVEFKDSGLIAMLSSIGSYEKDPSNPQRLLIKFDKLRVQLSPVMSTDPAKKAEWLRLMRPHNPNMNDDGMAEVELPKMPAGYEDYLVMLPGWIVGRGNQGAWHILKRKAAVA